MKKRESTSAEAAELRRCAEARSRSKAAGKNLPRTDADSGNTASSGNKESESAVEAEGY